MNINIKSTHVFALMIGTIFGVISGIFGFLGHGISFLLCSVMAILYFVVAIICYYHKPKYKGIGVFTIKGFKFRDK